MPRTIEKTVYSFDELSDAAKEKARETMRQWESESFDVSCVYDDAKELGKILGIDIGGGRNGATIYYSGFSSQGDGACFEGSYSYAKGAAKRIRDYAPTDTELHRIADELQALQRRAFYRLSASMSHRGHYYHSGCMAVSVDYDSPNYQAIPNGAEDDLTQLMRDFADWIYKQLESDYENRMEDESIDETIRANEYEFDENGAIT